MILIAKQDEVSTFDTQHWKIRYGFTDTEVSLAKHLVQGISVKNQPID